MEDNYLNTNNKSFTDNFALPVGMAPALALKIHTIMVKARALEERLIKMFKQNQGSFWIGGPGEEAFNVALGLQVKKGQGLAYDYLHLHYRSSAILLAMGMDPIEPILQMKNTASDPHSGGRNFSGHYSVSKWNVVPITSTIETQYLTGIGTGIAQKACGGDAITIINGGDAGSAEGDFTSCLIWSSRPNNELPILIIVNNNNWGISTAANTQHGETNIADRGKAFGIRTMVVDGNNVYESFVAIKEAMQYVRSQRKPFLLEAKVSRLYGHSSASGACFQQDESDPIKTFEDTLKGAGLISKEEIEHIHQYYQQKMRALAEQVKSEPPPKPLSIYDHVYKNEGGYT